MIKTPSQAPNNKVDRPFFLNFAPAASDHAIAANPKPLLAAIIIIPYSF